MLVAYCRLYRHCRNLAEGACLLSRFHFTRSRYFLAHVACRNLRWQGLFLVKPHPSPNISLSFYRVELGDQGTTKMAPYDGALWWRPCPTNFKWKHGFCQNAAWSFSSVTYYFLDHLNEIKRKYFLWDKKAYVLSDKALILHVHREFWS